MPHEQNAGKCDIQSAVWTHFHPKDKGKDAGREKARLGPTKDAWDYHKQRTLGKHYTKPWLKAPLYVFHHHYMKGRISPPNVLHTYQEKVNVYLPSLMMKVPNHLHVLGDTYACHTYCCYAYHFYAYWLYFIYVWHVYVSPKTCKWFGTFIIKDGRYMFTFVYRILPYFAF
jgi:hypothetical protein